MRSPPPILRLDMTTTKENLAFEALRQNYDTLLEAIGQPGVVHRFASRLYNKALITREVRDTVQLTSGLAPQLLAATLLKGVETSIQLNYRLLRRFVRVLRKETTFSRLADAVISSYGTLLSEHGQNDSGSSEPEDSPGSDAYGEYTETGSTQMAAIEALELYPTYLKGMYTRFQMPLDDQWPPVQSDDYVPLLLALTDLRHPVMEVEVTEKVQQALKGKVENIASPSGLIELNQLFESNEVVTDVRSVLIEGAPGIGKTAFSLTVCKKWAAGKVFQNFRAVILWSLKDPRIAEFTSVDDLIYHDSEEIRSVVILDMRKYSGKGFLFVLDGWDELPNSLASNKQNFLLDLVKGKTLPLASVIVTSRSIRSQKLLKANYFHRSVEIRGFSQSNIKEYVRRCFRKKPSVADQLLKQLDERPDVQSICYVPMHCAIVSYVFSRKLQLPATLTNFYSFLARNSLLRNIQLRSKEGEEISELEDFSDLPQEAEDLFLALCELAFRGLWIRRYTYTRDEIAAVCQSSPGIIVNIDSLGILQAVNVFHSSGLRSAFHFLHSTVQEFMAAKYLVSLPLDRQSFYTANYLSYLSFHMVWQFYCGMAAQAGLLQKCEIVPKFSSQISEITEVDAAIHDCFSLCSSDEESESASEEEEAEETLGLQDHSSHSQTTTAPTSSQLHQFQGLSTSNGLVEEGPSVHLTLPSSEPPKSDDSEPSTALRLSTFPEEMPHDEEVSASGDHIGSQKRDLGELSGVSLTLSKVSATLAVASPPATAYKNDREDLLFVLRCAYESQLPSFCSSVAQQCHERLFFKANNLSAIDTNAIGYLIAKSHVPSRSWQVQFVQCGIGAQHLAAFRHQLQSKHARGKIKRFYIRENKLDVSSLRELTNLASALALCERLTLSGAELGDDEAKLLSTLVTQLHSLRALNLSSNSITDAGITELCGALESASTLTHIDLSFNSISITGAERIAQLMELKTLTYIDIGSNDILDEGATHIAAALGSNPSLVHLDLSSNSLTEVSAAYLATALSVNTLLHELVLHSNPIGSSGADLILSALSTNSTLHKLDLDNCSIQYNDALKTTIQASLPQAKTLQKLELAYNSLTDEGISAVLEAAGSSASIRKLSIADNEMGPATLQELGALLCLNTLLQKLTIAAYELVSDFDAFETFCDCLIASEGLRVLEIHDAAEVEDEIQQRMDDVNAARKYASKRKLKLKFVENE